MISLAADVNADGTGNDGLGTLSINAGATVVSSNTAASAITLRGADVNIDTSSNAAVVGSARTGHYVQCDFDWHKRSRVHGLRQQRRSLRGERGNNTVSKFAPGATSPSATLTGLNLPAALAFDASGNLYVTNYSGNTVSKFAPGSTSPSAT